MRSRVLSHAAALGCTCPGTVYVHVRVDVLGVPHVDIEHAAGCAASVAAATSVQS